MFLFSPLEQFEITLLKPINFFGYDLSMNNASLALILAAVLFILLFFLGFHKARLVPGLLQYSVENLYVFIINVITQQAGRKGLRYFPIFFVIFFLVFFSSLLGLLPFSFAPTSHLVFTFSLAFTCNLAFIIIGFKENGLGFLRLFTPKRSPIFLLPVIVLIELISYLLRTFSLSIRLFANIMAGHTLLHILASFVTTFINAHLFLVAFFPFLLILGIIVLEIAIAAIQAYVFLILLSIYLNDSFHPSH